jgi:hypothetical protein
MTVSRAEWLDKTSGGRTAGAPRTAMENEATVREQVRAMLA